jgi:hypothetical protein
MAIRDLGIVTLPTGRAEVGVAGLDLQSSFPTESPITNLV